MVVKPTLDDVVIHCTDYETHLKCVQEVLTRFSGVKLTVNLSKSEFGHTEAVFWKMRLAMGKSSH